MVAKTMLAASTGTSLPHAAARPDSGNGRYIQDRLTPSCGELRRRWT